MAHNKQGLAISDKTVHPCNSVQLHVFSLHTTVLKPPEQNAPVSGCYVSVLLQSFSQEIVQAGNHWPWIVVQACCDHGVVIDLQNTKEYFP